MPWANCHLLSVIITDIYLFKNAKSKFCCNLFRVFFGKEQFQLCQCSHHEGWLFALTEHEYFGWCPKGSQTPVVTPFFSLLWLSLHRQTLLLPPQLQWCYTAFNYSWAELSRKIFSGNGDWIKRFNQKILISTHTSPKMRSWISSTRQMWCSLCLMLLGRFWK